MKTKFAAAIVVVVAIIVIAGFFFKAWHAGGPAPVYAPHGEIVSGFPQELILDNAARVSNSYSIAYAAALNQYTVEWNSSSSPASLFAMYQDYFLKNHWTIVNSATSQPNFRGLYARLGTATVNLSITLENKSSRVGLSYSK